MKGILGLIVGLLLLFPSISQAEYRAYRLEVYDQILGTQWDAVTGFAPDLYINTHGGGNRLSAVIKATWMCYGDLSRYSPACVMPPTKDGLFEVGDKVEVLLKKHLTNQWKGVVELSLWREDLKSNVYGIRFGDRKDMYGRYYEFDLKLVKKRETVQTQSKTKDAPPPEAVEAGGGAAQQPPAVQPAP